MLPSLVLLYQQHSVALALASLVMEVKVLLPLVMGVVMEVNVLPLVMIVTVIASLVMEVVMEVMVLLLGKL